MCLDLNTGSRRVMNKHTGRPECLHINREMNMTTLRNFSQLPASGLRARAWMDAERRHRPAGPLIAVTREPGAGGEELAATLARELGYVLYDRELVEQIARDTRVSEQMVASLDEKVQSQLNDWLADFAGYSGLSSFQYMQSLRRILFAIAARGNAVILGRGGNFLLPPGKRTLGILFVAPLETRIRNIMKSLSLTRLEAREYIVQREHEQQAWVRIRCNADITDVTNYHLVINTAQVKPEVIVGIVREMVRLMPEDTGETEFRATGTDDSAP